MKLITFFLFVVLMQVNAKGYSQNITLNMDGASLEEVLLNINRQTGFSYSVNNTTLQKARPITIHISNATIHQVLDSCFKGQQLTYSILNRIIIIKELLPESQIKLEQKHPPINVEGKVTDEIGEPVSGASIQIKGTGKGTSTDENGEFELNGVDANTILIISGTNIVTLEVKVEGKTDLRTVTVKRKIGEEKQVIISTGYTKVSAERFTGSYAQLSKDAFESRAGMDLITRLDGLVTGVLFDRTKTGNEQLKSLQIRGLSTIPLLEQSPNPSPLIIVDNFPYKQDITTINPNDVETITVLKDAAATSIWGAQAGNGVIVITTKKGKYNRGLLVSVRSNVSIAERPDQYYYPQMSIPDFVDAEVMLFNKGAFDAKLANANNWPVISPVVETLAKRRAGQISSIDSANQIDAFKSLDVRRDLYKYAYRPQILQQHYVNLSGGNEIFNFGFSAGFDRKLTNIQNTEPDDKITINTNMGFRPVKNLEITTGINFSQTTQRSIQFELNTVLPYVQLADAEGHPLAVPYRTRMAYLDTVGKGSLLDWKYRPLTEPGLRDRKYIDRLIMLNVGMNYRFTKWLDISLSYQYGNGSNNDRDYSSPDTWYTRNLVNRFTNLFQTAPALRNPVPFGGILSTSRNELITQNVRSQLNFHKNIGFRHQLAASVAAELSETKTTSGFSDIIYGYDRTNNVSSANIDYVTFFPIYGSTSGETDRIVNGSSVSPEVVNRFVSFVSYLTYIYNNRYTLYASARKDGSNLFGVNTNRKWKPLWSAAMSWEISKEPFYNIKWMPSLRARFSYGYSGNPGNGSGLPLITYGSIPTTIGMLPGAYPHSPPNPDLRWEKIRSINSGIDFSLFNNRISGNIDIWQKRSTDIIALAPLAPSTGNNNLALNTASLKANGFEININSINISKGQFRWQTNFGFSHAKTIVEKLYFYPRSAQDFVSYGLNVAEGQIAYGIASYKWAGLDPQTGNPRGYLNKQVSTDYNAIANDSIGNQAFHGSAIPLYHGFIRNSFSWKRFTFSATIGYRFDFYFRKPTINYSYLVNSWQGNADYSRRWQKPGDENYTTVPSFIYPFAATSASRDFFYQYSEVNVLRGDNIRLQDIGIEYSGNNKAASKIPFKNYRIFANANNVNAILWRKEKSKVDADFSGVNFPAPPARTWTLGLSFDF